MKKETIFTPPKKSDPASPKNLFVFFKLKNKREADKN